MEDVDDEQVLNRRLRIRKNLAGEELVNHLELIFNSLEDLDTDAYGQYVLLWNDLEKTWLRKHECQQVRHLVIGCSSLLIASFGNGGDQYQGDHLEKFLKFVVNELANFKKPESTSAVFDLIEMLFELGTFLTAADESFYASVCCSLVQTLLDALSGQKSHVESKSLMLLKLMSQVIGGSDDIPASLLDIIFNKLIEPSKSRNTASYSISVRLIDENRNILEKKIISFFDNCLTGKKTGSRLSIHVYHLLSEVLNVAPELLVNVLPKLKYKLLAYLPVERRKAVEFVGQLFAKVYPNLIREQPLLWAYFLDRFEDVNVNVRIACVLASEDVIVYHSELLTYSPDGPSLIDHLVAQSCDVHFEVRLNVVGVILRALKCKPNIPERLFQSLLKRTSDINANVRMASVVGLARLFTRICEEMKSLLSNFDQQITDEDVSSESRRLDVDRFPPSRRLDFPGCDTNEEELDYVRGLEEAGAADLSALPVVLNTPDHSGGHVSETEDVVDEEEEEEGEQEVLRENASERETDPDRTDLNAEQESGSCHGNGTAGRKRKRPAEDQENFSDDSEATCIYDPHRRSSKSSRDSGQLEVDRVSDDGSVAVEKALDLNQLLTHRARTIANTIVHAYRSRSLNDRNLIEDVLNSYLVPRCLSCDERTLKILVLFNLLDKDGVSYFKVILKMQQTMRFRMKDVLKYDIEMFKKADNIDDRGQKLRDNTTSLEKGSSKKKSGKTPGANQNRRRSMEETEEGVDDSLHGNQKTLNSAVKKQSDISLLLENISEEFRSAIKLIAERFSQPPPSAKDILQLLSIPEIHSNLVTLMSDDCLCENAYVIVKSILARCRSEKNSGSLVETARVLLQRTASLMIDMEAVVILARLLDQFVTDAEILGDNGKSKLKNLLNLLQVLSSVNKEWFQVVDVYESLLPFINAPDVADSLSCLQIFVNVCEPWLKQDFPEIYRRLTESLVCIIKSGIPDQIKYAIHCMRSCGIETPDQQAMEIVKHHLNRNWSVQSLLLPAALAATRLAVKYRGVILTPGMKQKVLKLLTDELLNSKTLLTLPSYIKIEAMKLFTAVLLYCCGAGDRTLAERFLLIIEGFLRLAFQDESGHMSYKKRLGKAAACCLVRLARHPLYDRMITFDQFYLLGQLFNDEMEEIHEAILRKVNKGLWTFTLSNQYLAMLSLVPVNWISPAADRRCATVAYLIERNVGRRRSYVNLRLTDKEHVRTLLYILPDYSIAYVIHLLAHLPELHSQILQRCLALIVRPLLANVKLSSSMEFHRKIFKMIKISRDAQCSPEDQMANKKMHAVADLAMKVLVEESNEIARQMEEDGSYQYQECALPNLPSLPPKLFRRIDADVSGSKSSKILNPAPNNAEPVESTEPVESIEQRQIMQLPVTGEEVWQIADDEREGPTPTRRASKITDFFKVISKTRESVKADDGDGCSAAAVILEGTSKGNSKSNELPVRSGTALAAAFSRGQVIANDDEDDDHVEP